MSERTYRIKSDTMEKLLLLFQEFPISERRIDFSKFTLDSKISFLIDQFLMLQDEIRRAKKK